MYEIGDVVIDRTYNKNGVLAIVVGTGIQQPILLYHNKGIFCDELGDGFSTWDGLEMVGHIDFEKVWKEAVRIADRKTEPTCSKMEQVDKPQTDCNGCKFVGTYDTEFPCANCSRKTKDYYAKDEPQTFDDIGRQIQYAYDKGLLSDASAVQAWYEAVKGEQTDCPWK